VKALPGILVNLVYQKAIDFSRFSVIKEESEVFSWKGRYSSLLGTKDYAFGKPKTSKEWKTDSALSESGIWTTGWV